MEKISRVRYIGVFVVKMGSPVGSGKKLSPKQEEYIKRELVRQRLAIEMPLSTMGIT